MDISLGENKEIVLASILCFHINLGGHMRRSCVPLLVYWVGLCFTTFLSDCSLFAHVTGVSALVQQLMWEDQSCYFLVPVSFCCTVSTRSGRWWSLCLTYTQNWSRVVSLLNFGIASLLFLVIDGYDKPSRYWRSIYVVGRIWGEVEVCLVWTM